MRKDILERLRIDPGQRTLGELLQDREAAIHEIAWLRAERAEACVPGTAQRATRLPSAIPEALPRKSSFRPGTLIRIAEVRELIGLSRSMVYRLRSEGKFPEPVRLGARSVRWSVDAIVTWCDNATADAARRA